MTEQKQENIDNLVNQLNSQRYIIGNTVTKLILNTALKAGRKQAKDKEAYDKELKENANLVALCQELKIEL